MLTKFQQETLKSRFAQAKVLVVGDVMLDRYWFGDVSRISPEAPVPVAKIGRIDQGVIIVEDGKSLNNELDGTDWLGTAWRRIFLQRTSIYRPVD